MALQFKPKLSKTVFQILINDILGIALGSISIYLFSSLISDSYKILVMAIAFAILMLIVFIASISTFGNIKNTSYYIDENKITYYKKFVSEEQIDIPEAQITNIDYTISWFLDKIFKTGTIKVYTAGTAGTDMNIKGITSIEERYTKMREILDLRQTEGDDSQAHLRKLLKKVKPNAGVATFVSSIPLLILALFTFGISIIFTFFIPILVHKAYSKKEYYFYTDKLEYYDGFLTFNKSTVPNERITDIGEERTIFDRIFDTSTIQIQTAGSSGSEIQIRYVKNGSEIIRDLREDLKKHGRD